MSIDPHVSHRHTGDDRLPAPAIVGRAPDDFRILRGDYGDDDVVAIAEDIHDTTWPFVPLTGVKCLLTTPASCQPCARRQRAIASRDRRSWAATLPEPA